MQCTVRSPDQVYLDSDATLVVAQSARGEFALMDGHAPLLAQLADGPFRVETPEGTQVFACFGATLHVEDDAVSVLVEDAVPAHDIDAKAVAEQLRQVKDTTSPEYRRLTVLAKVGERRA